MSWTPRLLAALDAEAARKQTMEDAGVDPGNPAEREAWEAGYDARSAEIGHVLDDWYEMYRRFSRVDEDVFLALRNRLIPLTQGEPVQFQELGRRRWFNGTYDGPVDNPGDPNRAGDVIVLSRSGRRVSVFLSSVRRRPGR
jgi:hypothetical protein